MNLENFDAVGEVELQTFRFDDNGEKVYFDYFEKNNLVVKIGRAAVVDLILGESRKKLTFIAWGRGGAPEYPQGNPLDEFDVEDKDEALAEEVIKKLLNPHERLEPTRFRFTETLISDEVDSNINEAALVFRDVESGEESMFARITFPTIALLADKGFGIELAWTVNFRKVRYRKDEEKEMS